MKIRRNFPIKNLSTFKIGGRADYFCEVKSEKELIEAIAAARKLKIPYKLLAGGSNVVFPDRKLDYFLIKINQLTQPRLRIFGNKIEADAGAELMDLVKASVACGLRGLETLSGIPGTVGGAIIGNAGAYGHSISEVVEKAEVLSDGRKMWLKNSDCNFQYRHSVFKEKPFIVLRAVLNLKKGNPEELKKISKNIIIARLKKYKPGLRCPGSFFKNVLIKDISARSLKLVDSGKIIENKIPAGYLLEQVGAKGMRIGGIRVADFHGNLFINDGKATAGDVKKISGILKNKVKKKFGINLEKEVRYF